MKHLNWDYLNKFDKNHFRKADPYPHCVFENTVKPESLKLLIENLPDIKLFEKSVGKNRAYGQKSHDRYILEYENAIELPAVWTEFIKELESKEYHQFLSRLFGTRFFKVRYHWHYSFTGCSVSPHCDGLTKLGSQIFYMNTESDWKKEWGGETLILKPHREIPYTSNPEFKEFDIIATSGPIGNSSLLFQRTDNAWHGVREIQCPDESLRKVFILVMDVDGPAVKIKKLGRAILVKIKAIIS